MRTILAWICLASVVESLLLIFNININRICITQIPVEFQPVVFPKDSCFQKLHIPTSPHPTNSTPHSADHLPGGLKPSTWNNKSHNPPDFWVAVFFTLLSEIHSLAIVSCCQKYWPVLFNVVHIASTAKIVLWKHKPGFNTVRTSHATLNAPFTSH